MPSDVPADRPTGRHHPTDVAGWVRVFTSVEIPVLSSTAAAVEELRAMQDVIDARTVAEEVAGDPLMSLKVMAFAAQLLRHRRNNDAETVREALVLIGIHPFFSSFGPQSSIETYLADQPDALEGLKAVLTRAERAGHFAAHMALHRQDHDAEVIYLATLLHDFAEMLLWLSAPELAREMRLRQQEDRTLRSATVQRLCLHVTLAEIQHALMHTWHLPDLLVRITDDRHAMSAQVRNVLLAVRLARHTSEGWDNPAVPDDVNDIAHLLTLSPATALDWLQSLER